MSSAIPSPTRAEAVARQRRRPSGRRGERCSRTRAAPGALSSAASPVLGRRHSEGGDSHEEPPDTPARELIDPAVNAASSTSADPSPRRSRKTRAAPAGRGRGARRRAARDVERAARRLGRFGEPAGLRVDAAEHVEQPRVLPVRQRDGLLRVRDGLLRRPAIESARHRLARAIGFCGRARPPSAGAGWPRSASRSARGRRRAPRAPPGSRASARGPCLNSATAASRLAALRRAPTRGCCARPGSRGSAAMAFRYCATASARWPVAASAEP